VHLGDALQGRAVADIFNKKQRSRVMATIKSGNTKPELAVRRFVHGLGYRYRLHRPDLPGRPDLALTRHCKAIFVHGCFWHGHPKCPRAARPTSNTKFWNKKLDRNIQNDRMAISHLRRSGWRVLIVWECDIRRGTFRSKVAKFLNE
jgi:DNA mismatch endonuclease, patch repair protein